MIIAVDGPAASGKGTIARQLAAHFELPYLDTGLLYRAVGHAMLAAGEDPHDTELAVSRAHSVDVSNLDVDVLRTGEVGEAASVVAAIPEVRRILFDMQRSFARRPGGAIIDGRDIGTVICPDADVKLYVDASLEVRARRRHAQLTENGEDLSVEDVVRDIRQRDERDKARMTAPLQRAEDALLLDTTNLGIEAAVAQALEFMARSRTRQES